MLPWNIGLEGTQFLLLFMRFLLLAWFLFPILARLFLWRYEIQVLDGLRMTLSPVLSNIGKDMMKNNLLIVLIKNMSIWECLKPKALFYHEKRKPAVIKWTVIFLLEIFKKYVESARIISLCVIVILNFVLAWFLFVCSIAWAKIKMNGVC